MNQSDPTKSYGSAKQPPNTSRSIIEPDLELNGFVGPVLSGVMTTFLCSVGAQLEDNYRIGLAHNLWGVKDTYEHRIRKTNPGDQIAFIVGGVFRSLHRIESPVFEEYSHVWPRDDGSVFPFRIRISDPIATSSKDARHIGDTVSFIRGKLWSGTIEP